MKSLVEALVLTGGASRRMGTDKSQIPIDGVPMAQRIIQSLTTVGLKVTVLGRHPIDGVHFQRDLDEFGGPLAALAAYQPKTEFVFVASCDLPLFDARVVSRLTSKIGESEVAIPIIGDRPQPLCAVYRASTFIKLTEVFAQGERRIMTWLDRLNKVELFEFDLLEVGISPMSVLGVNTKSEFERATLNVTSEP